MYLNQRPQTFLPQGNGMTGVRYATCPREEDRLGHGGSSRKEGRAKHKMPDLGLFRRNRGDRPDREDWRERQLDAAGRVNRQILQHVRQQVLLQISERSGLNSGRTILVGSGSLRTQGGKGLITRGRRTRPTGPRARRGKDQLEREEPDRYDCEYRTHEQIIALLAA